jgi:single-stranded-DNA-specific exonuclease
MGVPMDAFRLLVAEDENQAEGLAEHLDHINNERKGVVASLVKEVKRKIKERYGEKGKVQKVTPENIFPNVLVLGNPHWKPSLLGLAANTCVEEFDRPVFLWGRDGYGLYKGSCRTVDGDSVHLVELMTALPPLTFTQFGGHIGAGGFTVHPDAIFNLEETINNTYTKIRNDQGSMANDQGGKKDFVDGIIRTDDITWDLYDEINKFAPFGTGNPKPIFMIQDATIASVKHFGKEKNHLELLLTKDPSAGRGGTVSAIAFFKKSEDFGVKLEIGSKTTVIGTLEKSTFKWKPELRVRIMDVQ